MAWVEVGTEADVARRRKMLFEHKDDQIAVIAHEGRFYALANVCIHRQRELSKGVILRDRIVCPGHQWAFELSTGWEATKERCQPTYDVKVEDGIVFVDVASRRTQVAEPTGADQTPV